MTAQTRLSRWLASAVAVGVAIAAVGCGGSGASSGRVTGGPIELEISQFSITVANRSGTAIANVKLEVIPVGAQTIFSATHYRLESNADKDFSYNDLRGSDGTPFNLRVHKPRTVRVTANGVDGAEHELEMPW